jgi:chromate transporter
MSEAPITFSVPVESYPRLFWRFLRFGLLAWGGPVAQIAMIRQELVDDERWISPEQFNRVLAVYQVLPGPEASELCVYFGMLSRGRPGALLGGLGFMLPGFVLMFILSWLYVSVGLSSGMFVAALAGVQPAVVALIVRAVHRIGQHALTDRWLLGIAIGACLLQALGMPFGINLLGAGLAYALVKRQRAWAALALAILMFAGVAAGLGSWLGGPLIDSSTAAPAPTPLSLFLSGLKAGLLTFGGAYTSIPFIQHDAVVTGHWMTNRQFLDGLALSGVLPAPLIIFSTFVGYLGGGPAGALAMTVGIYAPAFGFTMLGHEVLEKVVQLEWLHSFLDGVTAGVVGLIAFTALGLIPVAITSLAGAVIAVVGLIVLYRWKSKLAVPAVIVAAGLAGLILLR